MKTYLHYPMKSLVNCRDLGGIPTNDGGVTRFGVLIRSELPSNLPEEDIRMFRELNVTTSLDLRSNDEIKNAPSSLKDIDFIDYKQLTLSDKNAEIGSDVKKPHPPKSLAELSAIQWTSVYCGMLEKYPDWAYNIIDAVISAKGCVHFHCATGKDRTGMFSALILSAVGCAKDDIIANYCVSEVYMRPYYLNMIERITEGKYEESDLNRGFFSTSKDTMRTVLNTIDEKYGGVIAYLKECGVTDEMIRKLKEKIVEY